MLSISLQRPAAGAWHRPERPGSVDFSPTEVLARPLALAQGAAREELRALARENDPALFFEGLMGFAGRQEMAGRLDLAGEAYATLIASASATPLASRAQTRLDAILGRGPAGPRTELLLRNFVQQTSDPAALFAMGAAGAVFRLTRLATLGRLAVSPSANLVTRGFGARATASLVAFAAEAPSFVLAGRGANAVLGRSQEWSREALGREFASSYLVLGGLKLAGWGSGSLYRRLASPVGSLSEGPLRIFSQQGGMLAGILLGHSLEEQFGLRLRQDGATTLLDSLAMLLQFNVAGNLTRHAFGPRFAAWEHGLDIQTQRISQSLPPGITGPGFGAGSLAWAGAASAVRPQGTANAPFPPQLMAMAMQNQGTGGGRSAPNPVRLPRLGIRRPTDNPNSERLNRQEAERQLRALVPRGFVESADLDRPGFISQLLTCFGVTDHVFDQGAFRRGFEIARAHPERVARLAFDIDEVYLHWALSPADIFRGTLERGVEATFRNTEASLLDYARFETAPGVKLNFFERLWFNGIQRLFPGRLRQRIQFHPGVRAFQLGLRLGQDKNLIMATTGPAGRILRLANEDPAMKMIYFGKGPSDPVTIAEVREGLNIYTREDLVLAMREASSGEIRFPENPQVESYLAKIREFPSRGVKLKHPAIALLRGKRPFDSLVDDSGSTFEMLGGLDGFSVLQPPSARPGFLLNFTLLGTDRYLDHMVNGYVHELGQILAANDPLVSTRLNSGVTAPEDYPLQRFDIEIPWQKFGEEFVAPNRELRTLGRGLARALPVATAPAANQVALSLSEAQLQGLAERIHREFDLILDERPGSISVEANHTLMYRDLSQETPEDFQALMDRYFTAQEQSRLPQAQMPLAERGGEYFSRIAGLMSAKKAVCQLLGLDPAEHALEVLIRHGRPALTGTAGQRLGSGNILTTYADQGEVGLGIALIEPSTWSSGLVGIGIHLTNERFEGGQAWKQALEGAAHRATYAMRSYGEAIPSRAADIDRNASGETLLSGLTMAAARELRGDSGVPSPLKVRAINFSIGEASVGLVVVPSLDGRRARRVPMRPFGEGMPESGGARAASKTSYVRDEDGYFQLPEPGMTVVTLGDVSATRSIELARQGHHSIHIERDPEMLEMAERLFSASVEDFTQNRPEMDRPMAQFREGDWYETRTQADRVEAYYPLHIGDVPRTDTPQFHPALRQFLNQALLSKLAPGGSGFVISEFRELVSGLEQVIREDPRLELVEVAYDRQRLPLIGGFGVTHRYSANSYLVFRLKP